MGLDFCTIVAVTVYVLSHQVNAQTEIQTTEFLPLVSARCERGNMTIEVQTELPFFGVVHVKDYRKSPCESYGDGKKTTKLVINLLASKDSPTYCGIITTKTSEQSLALAVRVHKTLELSDDKLYFITCGKSDFKNSRNQMSRVSLFFTDGNNKVKELIYGHKYTLKAAISVPDEIYQIQVRSCISFAPNASDVPLLDSRGCPIGNIMSEFHSNDSKHAVESILYSVFRFAGTNKINIQCEVILCQGNCEKINCNGLGPFLPEPLARNSTTDKSKIQLLTSTSAFVLDPGQPIIGALTGGCSEWQFPWLIGLCICLAILLLVMLIVNIFLCSSVTCQCARTEILDKDSSEMEDYDPYKGGWSSSHYGSPASLNKTGYISGAESTLHSGSSASDHYATVQSRPGSGYSHHSSREPLHMGHRRPGSSVPSSYIYEPRL